jgi:hypothetical protein
VLKLLFKVVTSQTAVTSLLRDRILHFSTGDTALYLVPPCPVWGFYDAKSPERLNSGLFIATTKLKP